jgi:type VI secretion system secreted protein Hcp
MELDSQPDANGVTAPALVFEIEDFSFDVEQTLNIGSQGGGAGAGKISFNPFTITHKVDQATALLIQACVSGKHFPIAHFIYRKTRGVAADGTLQADEVVFRLDFQVVSVIASRVRGTDNKAPSETVVFNFQSVAVSSQALEPSSLDLDPSADK